MKHSSRVLGVLIHDWVLPDAELSYAGSIENVDTPRGELEQTDRTAGRRPSSGAPVGEVGSALSTRVLDLSDMTRSAPNVDRARKVRLAVVVPLANEEATIEGFLREVVEQMCSQVTMSETTCEIDLHFPNLPPISREQEAQA